MDLARVYKTLAHEQPAFIESNKFFLFNWDLFTHPILIMSAEAQKINLLIIFYKNYNKSYLFRNRIIFIIY